MFPVSCEDSDSVNKSMKSVSPSCGGESAGFSNSSGSSYSSNMSDDSVESSEACRAGSDLVIIIEG
jgi:hypothetical protein